MDRTLESLDYFLNYFLRRGRMQTVVTEGGVEDELLVRREGGCCIRKCYWLRPIILSSFSTDYFFVESFALGRNCCWKYHQRSSAVQSCVSLSSRPGLVLNDTHWLSRIIHQLLRISLCVYSISLLNFSIFLLSLTISERQRSRSFRSLTLNFAA